MDNVSGVQIEKMNDGYLRVFLLSSNTPGGEATLMGNIEPKDYADKQICRFVFNLPDLPTKGPDPA